MLVPRLQALPVLLVITYRPEYTPHWAEQAHVTTLGLSRLARRQGAELVAKVTGGKALPAEVLEQIVAHTDGVPLFVEELTKSVLESGLLREAGDQYTLQTPLPALAIPTSLRDSLLARLDRLAPVKDIIQIGACIGREFSYELLARISALSDEQLEEALRKLTEAGLVYAAARRRMPPTPSSTPWCRMPPTTRCSRASGSSCTPRSRRCWRKTSPIESPTSRSCWPITTRSRAISPQPSRWWREAGKLAVRRVALQEAVGHFQKGLALIEQLPPSSERDGLELSIREPLNAAWTGCAAGQLRR